MSGGIVSSPQPTTVAAAAPVRPARGALTVLLLGSTLTVMAGAVLTPAVALVRDEFGLSGTQAGLVLTLHALSLAVTSPLAGALVDRHGPRGPLAAGLLVYGLAGGAGAVATSYPLLLATRAVFGIGAAAVFTATTVALLQSATGPRRDRVMGWRGTATSLGGVLWPVIGGAAAGLAWPAPFAVYLLGVPFTCWACRSASRPGSWCRSDARATVDRRCRNRNAPAPASCGCCAAAR
jgi:MFS family permease